MSATRTSPLLRVNAACSVPTARWVVGSVVRPSPPQIESFQADSRLTHILAPRHFLSAHVDGSKNLLGRIFPSFVKSGTKFCADVGNGLVGTSFVSLRRDQYSDSIEKIGSLTPTLTVERACDERCLEIHLFGRGPLDVGSTTVTGSFE